MEERKNNRGTEGYFLNEKRRKTKRQERNRGKRGKKEIEEKEGRRK